MTLSPNHGPRRIAAPPDLIVLHYTGMTSFAAARDRLCDPLAEVSAHWLIDEDGTTLPLVDEARRAWHAGAGSWRGRDDVNSRSIGIELQNNGRSPFPDPQMRALETLLRGIMARWSIPPHGVIAHSDLAPGRKIDPGPRFDWRRLAREGLSVWPAPAPAGDLESDLTRIGYADHPERLAAFRLRFRPGAAGPADKIDGALAAGLDAGDGGA
ncbi:N-acetylmuramoyl-L-alanine amidase [Falsirhodobacter halotolerans]|uniref:N-acetylmuramoyl-L-alanine amidase n=1 Tax=Falsirhodobacter halotolerans TaxID=1146892 RepID=UPI001FD3E009|nr:N-acetylmuramoyl-L-alanine amidase [Falsirhodobacter halotolerans]MCJ8140160.1 N-acetylmuramoyl-L-alanine amidase [Falsirhodobacter halotolerans]